jgi:hypothetical protein
MPELFPSTANLQKYPPQEVFRDEWHMPSLTDTVLYRVSGCWPYLHTVHTIVCVSKLLIQICSLTTKYYKKGQRIVPGLYFLTLNSLYTLPLLAFRS